MSSSVPPAKPWSKKAAEPRGGAWDYVVIGSGMGGMTTAALLAKLGKRVLVLEQHYVPGGFTHTFKRPGYRWDVGVHAVGEVTERSLPGRLLARLTDGRLQWASLGPVYDAFHFPGGFRIDFPDSPQQFRDNLCAAFPAERDAIDRYLALVKEVTGCMRRYHLSRLAPAGVARLAERVLARRALEFIAMRTGDVLAGLTRDERLRSVLAAQWGYYGSVPSRSSFAMHALVVKHFLHGGYYPVGGSRRIAETLLATVADAGGWTRIAADVAEIVVGDDDRATGVRLADGEVVHARRVVSAAGALPTLQRLLPVRYREAAWGRAVTRLEPAPAHVCLYLGFKGDVRAAGAGAANQWFYRTWSTEARAWEVEADAAGAGAGAGAGGGRGAWPPAPVLYCSFPSLKDPSHDPGPEQRHTGEVVTFVAWDRFAPFRERPWRKRGGAYDALKGALAESLREQFLAEMPALRPLVDYAELSTPVSTDHFTRPASGSIYGLEPTPERFGTAWLRPRTPIRDLFLSGSDMASVGVVGAMMGGVLCATAAEPFGALRLLREVQRPT